MTDLSGDGGVIKKLVSEGTGVKPPKGAAVKVNYVGKLEDGSEFDASSGYPYAFTLGEGKVIKGWELGIKSMKVGEKAVLVCTGPYAYGAEGSPPEIPPNATLTFDVELVDFTLNNASSVARNADLERLKKIREERDSAAKVREDAKAAKEATKKAPASLVEKKGKETKKKEEKEPKNAKK